MDIGRRVKVAGVAALTLAMVGAGMMGFGRATAAQDAAATPTAATWSPTISVSGEGSVTVTPDAATVSVGVNAVNANLSEAQAQANNTITVVLEALKAAGIAEKDIQTANYSVNLIQNYDSNGMPGEITGYQVNNQLNVTIRNLDKLGDILETAVAKGANSIYGVTFIVTDSSAAAAQARAAAVADATEKAKQLATAAGGKLGKIGSITESSSPGVMPMPYGKAAGMEAAGDSVAISSGSNTITVNVQMTFEFIQ